MTTGEQQAKCAEMQEHLKKAESIARELKDAARMNSDEFWFATAARRFAHHSRHNAEALRRKLDTRVDERAAEITAGVA